MNLNNYGWDEHFQIAYESLKNVELVPARIIADYGQAVRVITKDDELLVKRHVRDDSVYGVGDFVCLEYDESNKVYSVKELLPRKTKFSRAAVGKKAKEQIVAANIDTVFIVQSLNKDFNLRRLERYLISAWESGAIPVVVLTKSDLCENIEEKLSDVFTVAAGVETFAVSAVTGKGMNDIGKYFAPGKTVALLGSSGVGKSTLVNTLSGQEILKTQEVLRDDDKGRHTTTHRQLVLLPSGGVVMDTPGMRTMGLWESETGMENMFGDIEEIFISCRFKDCRHESEPGCAVKAALEDGSLDEARWKSYKKLLKELAHIERRKSENPNQAMRQISREFSKKVKNHNKVIW